MKIKISLIILSLLLIANLSYAEEYTLNNTPQEQTPVALKTFLFNRNLSIGSTNSDVLALKKILSYEINVNIDGTNIFDKLTEDLVKILQEKYSEEILVPSGLTEGTGTVGPATRKKLNELSTKYNIPESDYIQSTTVENNNIDTFTNTLKLGSVGDDVLLLKYILNSDKDTALFDANREDMENVSNIFGQFTLDAVKRFQEKYSEEILVPSGLTEGTGTVGPATRKKLNELVKMTNENINIATITRQNEANNNYNQTIKSTPTQNTKVDYVYNKKYNTNTNKYRATTTQPVQFLPATRENLSNQYGSINFLSGFLNSTTTNLTSGEENSISTNTTQPNLTSRITVQPSGEWLSNLPEAKSIAYKNKQFLIIQVGDNKNCSYTKKLNNLVFSKDTWKDYVKTKGLGLYFAKVEDLSTAEIRAELRTYYSGDWPNFLIFKVLPSSDLTNANLGENDVLFVGAFIYRNGKIINGIRGKLTPSSFIKILESFTN